MPPKLVNNMHLASKHSFRFYHVLTAVLVACICAQAQYTPGTSYFGRNRYIEYIAGNMPVIISAPHGGTIAPSGMKNRTEALCNDTSNFSTAEDTNTDDVVRALDTAMRNLIGCRPHTIICRLDRGKLDCNRDLATGACGDSLAQIAWFEFHNFINMARTNLRSNFARGLYIDFHGHGHTIQRLELGYGLSSAELRASDAYLNRTSVRNNSTIRALANSNLQNLNHAQLIRGTQAFGTMMANAGYPSVPSLQDSSPAVNEDYFNGGYNVRRYGTADSGIIDAIQIESNWTNVRNNTTSIKRFTDSLARIIVRYLQNHSIPISQINQCKTILPLELSFFNASIINNQAVLNWQILCSANPNAIIVVEKSSSNQSFQPIYTVSIAQNTCLQPFTFIDSSVLSTTAVYRLKLLDADGQVGYSHIVSLSAKNHAFGIKSIVPNPITNHSLTAFVQVPANSQALLQVTDVSGKILWQQQQLLTKGSNPIVVTLPSQLASGIYQLACFTSLGLRSYQRFLKP
jgi:hypothetical protein